MGSPIHLVAVMRFSDKTVLAVSTNGEVDKEGVREQVASNNFAKPGGKYSATGQQQSIHYLLDQYSKVYAIVTAPNYPARVAFLALEELRDSFQEKYGTRAATQGEESLTRVAKTMLDGIIEKYKNPGAFDSITAVQGKLDVVKTVMQENIQQILMNQEQVDRINSSAERLTEQSLAFKSTTNELRNKMFWKMVKMRLLIGGIIVAVLVVIIVPVVIMAKSQKK